MSLEEKKALVDPFIARQGEIFEQAFVRIILITSLAENSLKIQNVRYVIDSGLNREHHLDERTELSCQQTVPISRAQSLQREGIAGRHAPGKCYKIYTEEYESQMCSIEIQNKICLLESIEETLLFLGHFKDYIHVSDLIGFDVKDTQAWSKSKHKLVEMHVINQENFSLTEIGLFCVHMEQLKIRAAVFLFYSIRYKLIKEGLILSTFISLESSFLKSQVYVFF